MRVGIARNYKGQVARPLGLFLFILSDVEGFALVVMGWVLFSFVYFFAVTFDVIIELCKADEDNNGDEG